MNNNDDNNNNNNNKTVDEIYSGISNGSVFAEEFYQDIWFKHVLLISKQVKNLYKWTSIRWWQMRYLQRMTKHTVRTWTRHNTESCNHGSNLLESLINLSVSVTILLFTVKSKFSLPYNRVLRVKGAMFPIAFWSVTLGLLYRGHTRKKWNSFSFMNPHEQAGESISFIE